MFNESKSRQEQKKAARQQKEFDKLKKNKKGLAKVISQEPDGYTVQDFKKGGVAGIIDGCQPITNAAIGVGDQVVRKGKLIDAMRRRDNQNPEDNPQGKKFEKIKYVYSVMEGEQEIFYVGGHQPSPVLIGAMPEEFFGEFNQHTDVFINNYGGDKFVLDIKGAEKIGRWDSATKQFGFANLKDRQVLDRHQNIEPTFWWTWRGHGFWNQILEAGFDLDMQQDEIIGSFESGSLIQKWYRRSDYISDGIEYFGDVYLNYDYQWSGVLGGAGNTQYKLKNFLWTLPGQIEQISDVDFNNVFVPNSVSEAKTISTFQNQLLLGTLNKELNSFILEKFTNDITSSNNIGIANRTGELLIFLNGGYQSIISAAQSDNNLTGNNTIIFSGSLAPVYELRDKLKGSQSFAELGYVVNVWESVNENSYINLYTSLKKYMQDEGAEKQKIIVPVKKYSIPDFQEEQIDTPLYNPHTFEDMQLYHVSYHPN